VTIITVQYMAASSQHDNGSRSAATGTVFEPQSIFVWRPDTDGWVVERRRLQVPLAIDERIHSELPSRERQ
jgi:hypothetical protein